MALGVLMATLEMSNSAVSMLVVTLHLNVIEWALVSLELLDQATYGQKNRDWWERGY